MTTQRRSTLHWSGLTVGEHDFVEQPAGATGERLAKYLRDDVKCP